MKSLALVLIACIGVFAREPAPTDVTLWPGAAAGNPEDNGSMTVYLPEKGKATGAGVVVVPGGSFLIRCEDHEGTQVAKWLATRGIAAFVVHYRLIPRFTMREELDDVRRAAQMVREQADAYGVHRLGMIGFSAGAYLTGWAALKPLDKAGLDFMALVYGGPPTTNDAPRGFNRFFADQLGMEKWRELTDITSDLIAKAPPTFMFCTVEDRGAARRMGEFHLQLLQQGVSSEAHFFASGPHGVGLAQNDAVLGAWPELFFNWMRAKEFLSVEKSLPVSGLVKVNGKPIELGYVVFTSKDKSKHAPPRTAYIFNRSGEKGAFQLPEGQGMLPGKYEATVYQMAAKWNSVWAEPLLNRIQAKLNTGEKLTDTEIAEWKTWAANRHYKPTLPDFVRYPGVSITVTPQNAKSLAIEIASKSASR